MRIYNANTIAISDVLRNKIMNQSRLTGTRLTNNIHMLATVLSLNAKYFFSITVIYFAKINNILVSHLIIIYLNFIFRHYCIGSPCGGSPFLTGNFLKSGASTAIDGK